jgi:hypothetical protein
LNNSRMHVCLVCHTEPDVWNGGFKSIDVILPMFLDLLGEVRDDGGVSPRVCWCLTSQVIKNRPTPFLKLLEKGHEIGIHSHFPGVDGLIEHQQEINRNKLEDIRDWLPELCLDITSAGFPPPRTHVTWMFAYRDTMTQVLAKAGFGIDCSVCYGGLHSLSDGFLLADSGRRTNGKPYRLDETDHCSAGSSSVIELPVSGGFGSYWKPDGKGGFKYFTPVASDIETERMLRIFSDRLDSVSTGETDIFHIHFHLYDFLPPTGVDAERLSRAKRLLQTMAQDNRVCFSSPSDAVKDWSDKKSRSVI